MAKKTTMRTLFRSSVVICLLILALGQSGLGQKYQTQFGSYKLDFSYNHSKQNDKLRLGKATLKYSLKNDLLHDDEPIYSVKMTQYEELLRCDNISIETPELMPSLDCQPIEKFLINAKSTDASDYIDPRGLYVKRFSTRTKERSLFFSSDSSIKDFHFYALKDTYTTDTINDILAENNQTEKTFGSNGTKLGLYLEAKIRRTNSDLQYHRCNGKIFISSGTLGPSDLFLKPIQDLFAELDQAGQFLKEDFLISLKDFSCHRQGFGIGLDVNFTLIKRNQFPYWTCQHVMKTSPLNIFLNYKGSIEQQRGETEGSYKTRINIKSLSVLPSLSFHLKQIFDNQNQFKGTEEMFLILPRLYTVIVRGEWAENSLVKYLSLHDEKKLLQNIDEPTMALVYEDKPQDDYIRINLLIKKDSYRPSVPDVEKKFINDVDLENLSGFLEKIRDEL